MSNIFTMYGASDDLVEVSGLKQWDKREDRREEFSVNGGATFCLGGKLFITADYGDAGVWGITVAQVGDGVEIPWDINMKVHERGYSMLLEVAGVEDDVTLVRVHEED